MRIFSSIRVAIATGLCAVAAPSHLSAQTPTAEPNADAVEFFEKRIRPVLVERCYACHSASSKQIESGLLVDSRDGLMKGGNRGAGVELGDPNASVLITAISYSDETLRMPPEDAGGRLTAQQVADFETWIKQGAPYPEAVVSGTPKPTASESARRHWAFQPIGSPQPPAVVAQDWAQTEVDDFVLAKLEGARLTPSPPANRRTLLRRAKYDLLGLPPTWQEIHDFENDSSPHAYENLIERYLASPQYGERWGRYWLDVARYADTKGYVYAREERRFVHASAYRDWVIKAFNDDMPYDQFLVRQIAADQLVNDDPSSLAAMGFLTVGRRFINVIHDVIDDRIDVVCRGTMGLTVSCARCHDHKFDPIPTKDYYSLYGVFHGSTETMLVIDQPSQSPQSQAFEEELQKRRKALDDLFVAKRDELFDRLRGMVPQYLAAVPDVARLPSVEFYMTMGPDEINPIFVRQWHEYLTRGAVNDPLLAPWQAFAALPSEEFALRAPEVTTQLAASGIAVNELVVREFAEHVPGSMADVAASYGRLFSAAFAAWQSALEEAKKAGIAAPTALSDPAQEALRLVLYAENSPINLPPLTPAEAEFFFAEQAREELGKAQAHIDQWIIEGDGAGAYAVVLEDRPVQHNPHVLVRGNPKTLGTEVPRQFLEVLSGADRHPFQNGSGRLELARAIASPDNPLTARVIVNRIWLHHFGTGLVHTPSDFGLRSEPPTHPELLDYLARRFIDDGWSIKNLHRWMMLSSTYQQSSADRPDARGIDADNHLLWRMNTRRLDFEATRDSLLAVSGQLDATVGGRCVDLTSRPFPRRRTVYGYIDRLNLPTIYRSFDFASPDTHSPQRYETMVPQQALFLMNHPFVLELARQTVARPEVATAATPEAKIEALYQLILARSASPDEVALAHPIVDSTATEPSTPSPWSYGCLRKKTSDDKISEIKQFESLPFFTSEMWHAGPQLPELKCGWAFLTASGGDPGRTSDQAAVVRRWTSPAAGTLEIGGDIRHTSSDGDGVRASIVHSRLGELASWTLHKLDAASTVKGIQVQAGDTIDFVVEGRSDSTSDGFSWAPVLQLESKVEGQDKPMHQEWNAARDFSGPADPPLSPWERYAHVLLQTNEFAVVE